ncbi:Sterol 3-beta-glucosyltransferase [Gossypium australe]|uniref:Sterol 3-beta-glucosyltransferase n=1 Tax=Gossypium australe TaxID=47621 RepID=A0A5B6WD39_9ROSI|nr:Sterol 3-beta-glucosyltransferase [Gossypium australe]
MLGYDFSIAYKKGVYNIVVDALSRRSHMQEGQLFQCIGQTHITWLDSVTLRTLKFSRFARIFKNSPMHILNIHGMVHFFEGKRELWSVAISPFKEPYLICSMGELLGAIQGYKLLDTGCLALFIGKAFLRMCADGQESVTILVVVDRLTNYGHFIALSHLFTTTLVAIEYLQQIYKLHGPPESIVSDRDKVFLSHFWQELFKHLALSCTSLQPIILKRMSKLRP